MNADETVSFDHGCDTLTLHRSQHYATIRTAVVSTNGTPRCRVNCVVFALPQLLSRTLPLHPLDQFELAWSSGEVPDLQAYVATLISLGEESAISEVCQIDMEHRWRSADSAVRKFFASDYLSALQHVMQVNEVIELICWEYHVRNHWGDFPSVRVLLDEWSQYRPALDAAIQQTAASIARPIVMISGTHTPQEPFGLDGVLEVGRQHADEPPPFERVMTPDGCRLIVTANSDASISRRQLVMRRDSKSSVLVKNTSRNRAMAVIGLCILDAGESASCPMPARIHLGGKLILGIEMPKR